MISPMRHSVKHNNSTLNTALNAVTECAAQVRSSAASVAIEGRQYSSPSALDRRVERSIGRSYRDARYKSCDSRQSSSGRVQIITSLAVQDIQLLKISQICQILSLRK
jgi:hypothetical protein